MSYQNQFILSRADINKTTAQTATFNSASLKMPVGTTSVTFILDSGAGTGTTPTLDVSIQVSPDLGTTWYSYDRFAQVTTAAATRRISFSTFRGPGEAGVEAALAATGGALADNVTVTSDYRILCTIGGTSPSYASVKVWAIFAGSLLPPAPF